MNTNQNCSKNSVARLLLALLIVISFSSCAARRNPDVVRVQDELLVLTSDADVIANPSTELQEAEQAVNRAQDSWKKTHNSDEAEHLSYLAEKRIAIARVKTNQYVAQNEAARLSNARDHASLDARVNEAENAEQRASLAEERYEAMMTERQAQIQAMRSQLNDLNARETSRGLTLTLGDLLYESNRAELKPGATRKLSPLVTFLRQHPQELVSIEGHTDNVGAVDMNADLSSRRADVVRRYLIDEGVSSDRISTRGLGEEYPLVSNNTEAGRLQNRRVEIIVQNSAQ